MANSDLAGTAVGIVGAGSIGVAFAVQFATRGASVTVWDPVAYTRSTATERASSIIGMLADARLVVESPAKIVDRIRVVDELASACRDALVVQECAPERLDLKRELFRQVAAYTDEDQVLSSSTSAFQPSRIAAGLDAAPRMLVSHPGNPGPTTNDAPQPRDPSPTT